MSRIDGALLIDKPAGPTSHDVVQWVRWALRERSVGHCGTLDPGATGLLVVCVGGATRLVQYMAGQDKTYRARFALGRATDTADADGTTIAEAGVTDASIDAAGRALPAMVGRLELAPPAVSAIKIDGRRAHARARAGESFELPARDMRLLGVSDLRLAAAEQGGPYVEATLEVSKGSYVRSIGVELGRRIGLPVHLERLRRTRAGTCDLSQDGVVGPLHAQPTERGWRIRADVAQDRAQCQRLLEAALRDPVPWLGFPRLELAPDLVHRLAQGQRLSPREPSLQAWVEGPHMRAAVGAAPVPDLLIIVRFDPDGGLDGRVAPEKVVRMAHLPRGAPSGA